MDGQINLSLLSSNVMLKDNLQNIKGIYSDVLDTYAGRIDDAKSTLQTLNKNLSLANDEANGVESNHNCYRGSPIQSDLLGRDNQQNSNLGKLLSVNKDISSKPNNSNSRIASQSMPTVHCHLIQNLLLSVLM